MVKDNLKSSRLPNDFADDIAKIIHVQGPVIEAQLASGSVSSLFDTWTSAHGKQAQSQKFTIIQRDVRGRIRLIGEKALNLTRLFNIREGFTRQDDTLPQRLFNQPATRGPSKGQVVDKAAFEKMLDEYYHCMGWDKNGVPAKDKLKELGIDKIS